MRLERVTGLGGLISGFAVISSLDEDKPDEEDGYPEVLRPRKATASFEVLLSNYHCITAAAGSM